MFAAKTEVTVTGFMRKALKLGIVLGVVGGAAAAFNGCSTRSSSDGVQSAPDQTGSVGVALQLAPGLTLDTVSYTITGPGGFTKTGSLDVSHSGTVSGVIGGLPAGIGFSISLTGTTTDGSTSCLGSATFNVVAHMTTQVSVHLTCHQAPTTGSI